MAKTIFEWIEKVGGVSEAAKLLGEPARTLYSWSYGERCPRPETAAHIIKVAKGELDFNKIYGPVFARMAEHQSKQLIKKGKEDAE